MLQSMGQQRIRQELATEHQQQNNFHNNWFKKVKVWRRKWQPTPVFLPGESQGQRSLVGCRLWGRAESDTTEVT